MIEERVKLVGGVYEAELKHDNITEATFAVFTGPKLTGQRITSYVLSTPSLTPWKRVVRVLADVDTVYLTYESEGDTVEGEDVNNLQDAVIETQAALNDEAKRAGTAEQKLAGDLQAEITRAKAAEKSNREAIGAEAVRATGVETDLKKNIDENMKVVTAELVNRYTKDKVFTKEEVLARIEEIIGSAPEALDTLKEIAEALGNDPDFAGTMTKELAGKVDKINGKGLSANDYSDAEKAILADVNTKKHTHGNKSVLDGITQVLVNGWNEANSVKHSHGNKSALDNLTQATLDNIVHVKGVYLVTDYDTLDPLSLRLSKHCDVTYLYSHNGTPGQPFNNSAVGFVLWCGGPTYQMVLWRAGAYFEKGMVMRKYYDGAWGEWDYVLTSKYNPVATTTTAGAMSATDKAKLDALAHDVEMGGFLHKDQLIDDTETDDSELPAAAAAVYKNAEKLADLKKDITLTATIFDQGKMMMSDAADAPVKGLVIKGRSVQNSTLGQQLYDTKVSPAPLTIRGLSIVNNGDGSFTANGTPIGGVADFYLFGKWASTDVLFSGNISLYIYGIGSDQKFAMVNDTAAHTVLGGQIARKIDATAAFIRFEQDITYDKVIFWPMLYNTPSNGARADWEKYTGGQESPNPSYPQTIESITDMTVLSSVGNKNYFKQSSFCDQASFNNLSVHYPAWCRKELVLGEYTLLSKFETSEARSFFSRPLIRFWDNFSNNDSLTMSADIYIESYHHTDTKISTKSTMHIRNYNSDKSKFVDLMRVYIDDTIPINQWVTISATDILTEIAVAYGKEADPVFYVAFGTGTYAVRIRNVKIEISDVVTPYTPVLEDIPAENASAYRAFLSMVDLTDYTFRGIGDVQEKIECRNGEWGIERKYTESTMTGNESIGVYVDASGARYYTAKVVGALSLRVLAAKSNYFLMTKNVIGNTPGYAYARTNESDVRFDFNLPLDFIEGNTVDGFKEWLKKRYDSGEPVKVIHELITPVWEPFPDQIQEQFNHFKTYQSEHSTVYAVSDVPPDIELEYFRNVGIVKALFPTVLQDVQTPKGNFTWDDLKGV